MPYLLNQKQRHRTPNPWLISSLITFLLGFSCIQNAQANSDEHERIYYYQHTVIPSLVLNNNGRLFAELAMGQNQALFGSATQIVNKTFAEGISVRRLRNEAAILISFLPPHYPSTCYHMLIIQEGSDFDLYLLEKSDVDATGQSGAFVRERKANGQYKDYGAVQFEGAEQFIGFINLNTDHELGL